MIRSATASWRYASRPGRIAPAIAALGALALTSACVSTPAQAQDAANRDRTTVGDVMLTPLADLNLSRDPIPPVLIRAHAAPYDDIGLTACADIREEVGNLDAVLGEDFDTAQRAPRSGSAEGVAQSVVGSFIPFRGVIRRLSGAERHALDFQEAIAAGLSRRAYLKGLGQGMGCAYPSRPAPPDFMVRPEGAVQVPEPIDLEAEARAERRMEEASEAGDRAE